MHGIAPQHQPPVKVFLEHRKCRHCGYDLYGLEVDDETVRCPECGRRASRAITVQPFSRAFGEGWAATMGKSLSLGSQVNANVILGLLLLACIFVAVACVSYAANDRTDSQACLGAALWNGLIAVGIILTLAAVCRIGVMFDRLSFRRLLRAKKRVKKVVNREQPQVNRASTPTSLRRRKRVRRYG
jgi:hypothetical protein